MSDLDEIKDAEVDFLMPLDIESLEQNWLGELCWYRNSRSAKQLAEGRLVFKRVLTLDRPDQSSGIKNTPSC